MNVQLSLFSRNPIKEDNNRRRLVALNLKDRKQIEALLNDKTKFYSISEVARVMNKAKNTIVREVRHGGGRDKYNAEEQQKRAETERMVRYGNLSNRNAQRFVTPYERTNERIDILEMQVEILIDEVKKLKAND